MRGGLLCSTCAGGNDDHNDLDAKRIEAASESIAY